MSVHLLHVKQILSRFAPTKDYFSYLLWRVLRNARTQAIDDSRKSEKPSGQTRERASKQVAKNLRGAFAAVVGQLTE